MPMRAPYRAMPAAEARDADRPSARLTKAQKLELYYYMRLTRSLEERLVNLSRQSRVVGGVFRSLGQEADAVGSAFALDRAQGDFLGPLTRGLGAMLVQGAAPVEILRQYMAKGDSPSRGRDLNIHFADVERGFVGPISQLGDMVPVMAGIALSFKLRARPGVALVFAGDGATSTGAFHEGLNFAAVQRCPLVVVVENNGYAYSTPTAMQTAVKELKDKALAYGIPGVRADGNDVLATYDAVRRAVDRARRGDGVTLVELMTYRRQGHAEHDDQRYVPDGEVEWWEKNDDPIDRYVRVLLEEEQVARKALEQLDGRVREEVDAATELAERSPAPEPASALAGVYADPPSVAPLWYRRDAAASGGTVDG